MASEGLARALAAVLGGQGLPVHSCDSEPAEEPPAPVRLRKNVCYVVLAVFLNEQVSVRPPGPAPGPLERAASPGGDRGSTDNSHRFLVRGVSQFCKAPTLTLTSELCAAHPGDCTYIPKRDLRPRNLFISSY